MARVEECHNFATKTKAALVARSAAFLVHGRFVADIENANSVEKNGLPSNASRDSKHRFPNGRESYVYFSKTARVFELPKRLASNAVVSIACSITCEPS